MEEQSSLLPAIDTSHGTVAIPIGTHNVNLSNNTAQREPLNPINADFAHDTPMQQGEQREEEKEADFESTHHNEESPLQFNFLKSTCVLPSAQLQSVLAFSKSSETKNNISDGISSSKVSMTGQSRSSTGSHHLRYTAANDGVSNDKASPFLTFSQRKKTVSALKLKSAGMQLARNPSYYAEGIMRIFEENQPSSQRDETVSQSIVNYLYSSKDNAVDKGSAAAGAYAPPITEEGFGSFRSEKSEMRSFKSKLLSCFGARRQVSPRNQLFNQIEEITRFDFVEPDFAPKTLEKQRLQRHASPHLHFTKSNRLRRHVVIEVVGGQHFIREWQCAELLEAVNSSGNGNKEENVFPGVGILTYRDCRQVFTDVHQVSSLEVRRNCIVVCLPPVTCFVLCNKVFLLVVEDLKADALIQQLTKLSEYFTKNAKDGDTLKRQRPFEFVALECIITAAFDQLNDDILDLEQQFDSVEHKIQLKQHPSAVVLEQLHLLKEPVSTHDDRVKGFDKAFNELIADTEDLKRMELTLYYHQPSLYEKDRKAEAPNPDLLILLEYFDQELDQFNERVRRLTNSIKNTERLLALRLSLNRNRLIQLDLAATIIGAGIAIGTCLSGIFGMNLHSGFEDSHSLFVAMCVTISICCIGSLIFVLSIFKRTTL